ncbi:hypothetical protein BDP27DRAFT_1311994 [Rhodocollybia butyracea]|uniref:Uncharacterized protein n=1 Tax=Rhodocollybia butyracea TaxID=206335 RepID=A0A9P5UFF1_9AGAR|nr:hypothetical protein BDP27DRAFT_1311994 [Rhodocollybia butyracea]
MSKSQHAMPILHRRKWVKNLYLAILQLYTCFKHVFTSATTNPCFDQVCLLEAPTGTSRFPFTSEDLLLMFESWYCFFRGWISANIIIYTALFIACR